MSASDPSVVPGGDGTFALRIPREQRDVLRGLPAQLRELLDEGARDDEAVRRLFPSADPGDPEHAAEFEGLVRDDLLAQRTAAIEAMERTIDAERVTEDELAGWLGTVNDLRLVLGTRLDVTEETGPEDFRAGDPRRPAYALYAYLTYLQEQIVEALAGQISPPEGNE
jgi:hypothetical protein